jgi:hypothetical protein
MAEGRDAAARAEYAKADELGRPDNEGDEPAAIALTSALRARNWSTVVDRGRAFAAAYPRSPRLVEVYDAMLAAYQALPQAPINDVERAIDTRLAMRPDPMAYQSAASLLLSRRARLQSMSTLADEGRAAAEQFIHENESSYKLDGKVQGSLDRSAGAFADLAGWAAFLQGDLPTAERKLAEAERLLRGFDANNQWHLGDLSRKKNDPETAREHYLNLLGLAFASPAARDAAREALLAIRTAEGESPATFDRWLAETLERQKEERRKALLSSMAGKAAPRLALTDLQGHPVDLEAERGNVVLLNFFSAW